MELFHAKSAVDLKSSLSTRMQSLLRGGIAKSFAFFRILLLDIVFGLSLELFMLCLLLHILV